MKFLEKIFSIKNDSNVSQKIVKFLNYEIIFKNNKVSNQKKEPQWLLELKNSKDYIIDDENKFYKEPSGIVFDNINFGLYEVFYSKDYEIFFDKQAIFIDVGLNIGMASLFFANNKNIEKVYSFEPFTPTYNLAMKNIERNPLLKEKIDAFNFGLDKEYKEFEVPYSSAVSGCMSTAIDPFVLNNKICKNVENYETVVIKSASEILEPIISRHVNNNLIILKVDTEGSEFSIFEDLEEKGLLKNIDIIMLEYHFKSPKPLEEILSKNGFVVRYSPAKIRRVGMIFAHKLKP